ncbi:cupin domain-containing protein [Methanospirillum lacunae]|uniref:cupin domain-containing protein n=1 Tax=Methanospirillum lacunae TaxID=668570 RepID=UPI001FEAD770|nr:cupin domain-containing protein [Methanospirillum lacunae]
MTGSHPDIAYSVAHARIASGQETLPHTLLRSSEVYYILQGTGLMHIGAEEKLVSAGQLVYIPPGSVQFIKIPGMMNLHFLQS